MPASLEMGAIQLPAHDDHLSENHNPLTPVAVTSAPILSQAPASRLSLSFDSIPGDVIVDDPTVRPLQPDTKVSKFLSSLTGSSQSYDLIEEDDYDEPQLTPRVRGNMATETTTRTYFQDENEDTPVRTASISRQLPLNHPRPDLQSLQGAYVKNVERLEESAERLSMTSSLEGELQRMKMEQRNMERKTSASSHAESYKARHRQFSSTSLSNSIVDVNTAARAGGFSPEGYVASPVGSIRSPKVGYGSFSGRKLSRSSRLGTTLPEPELEGRPLEFGTGFSPPTNHGFHEQQSSLSRSVSNTSVIERPGTSGSGDTYQQANTLFTDFDGVHYHGDRIESHRQISLNRPPRARDARAFKEPQPGQEMVYYPAPVPVMLNLPVRLSRMNWAEHEKKRLQALGNISDDARKSAAWLADADIAGPSQRQSMAKLPPQLRASAFFEYRGVEQSIQLKNGSAVATLDDILDAAAHAPVSAFTDHPIVGQLGKEVYGSPARGRKSMQPQPQADKKAKRKSSMNKLLSRRFSGDPSEEISRQGRLSSGEALAKDGDGSDDEIDDAGRSLVPTSDEIPDHENENQSQKGSETDEDEYRPGFAVAPTTLLAELQMRKTQQKQRNRTAADSFPNGMHSTLLELDSVTQLQQKARKLKHVTLAWEDKEEADKENFDDDDVPLGVLFPEKDKQEQFNYNRPLGLLERRELEENEPLSSRRARLRGEPLPTMNQTTDVASHIEDASNVPVLDLPAISGSVVDDDPEESLAQRIKRLRESKDKGVSSTFSREVSGELGLTTQQEIPQSKTPDVEETLGQRRRRLQEEALKNGGSQIAGSEDNNTTTRPGLKTKRSLADVLQQNPIGYQNPNASKTSLAAIQGYRQSQQYNPSYLAGQQVPGMTFQQPHMQMPVGNVMQVPSMGYPAYQYQPTTSPFMNGTPGPVPNYNMTTPMNMNMPYNYGTPGYAAQVAALGMGPPLDAKQRANIDRWRQGIA